MCVCWFCFGYILQSFFLLHQKSLWTGGFECEQPAPNRQKHNPTFTHKTMQKGESTVVRGRSWDINQSMAGKQSRAFPPTECWLFNMLIVLVAWILHWHDFFFYLVFQSRNKKNKQNHLEDSAAFWLLVITTDNAKKQFHFQEVKGSLMTTMFQSWNSGSSFTLTFSYLKKQLYFILLLSNSWQDLFDLFSNRSHIISNPA